MIDGDGFCQHIELATETGEGLLSLKSMGRQLSRRWDFSCRSSCLVHAYSFSVRQCRIFHKSAYTAAVRDAVRFVADVAVHWQATI